MSGLRIHQKNGRAEGYAIFFHGLGSTTVATWSQAGKPGEMWPFWLADDLPQLGIALVEYDTPRSHWRGQAMHLTERAHNLLAELLANTALTTGAVVLVGHSLGGLIVKQMLRTAESMAFSDLRARNFLSRVRGVVFYASPHTGSHLATWADKLHFLVRPSAATASLVFGDPNLHDLNHWFREFVGRKNLKVLTFKEMQPMGFAGMVVTQESADSGIGRPIPIDANHVTITRVGARNDLQYSNLLNFLQGARHLRPEPSLAELLATSPEAGPEDWKGDPLMGGTKALPGTQAIGVLPAAGAPITNYAVLNAQLADAVADLRRRRFYCVSQDMAAGLAEQVRAGGYAHAGGEFRAQALAWIARVLRVPEHLEFGRACLVEARKLSSGREVEIVAALYDVFVRGLDQALATLASIDAAEARSAAFLAVTHERGRDEGLDWLTASGLTAPDLDADGKFAVISSLIDAERFDEAVDWAKICTDADREAVPALNNSCGLCELFTVVPRDYRHVVAAQVPFQAHEFPLASDSVALEARRRAVFYFEANERAARQLGCEDAANIAEITSLWLKLRAPGNQPVAIAELRGHLRDQPSNLRYITLALQFHLKMDLKAVEAEVDRQTALTGGGNIQVALARFALVFAQKSPADVIQYLDQHREQLNKFIVPKMLSLIEIEALASAGKIPEARELVSRVNNSLDERERSRVSRMLDEAQGQDPVALREQNYISSGQLPDLINLVNYLNGKDDFARLVPYAERFFEIARSVEAAEILGRALNNAGKLERLGDFIRSIPDIVEQSRGLKLLKAWTNYHAGDFDVARTLVTEIRRSVDDQNARDLYVNIAIGSGEWNDLLSYLEGEWEKRDARDPRELLRAASLARLSRSPRDREFAVAAAERAPDDAEVLIGAYGVATASGWEGQQSSDWLAKAIELSDEEGPVQRMSVKDLIDQQPDWNRRESKIGDDVAAGTLPMFLAAKGVRRSLLDLFLRPALSNLAEPDARRWATIPAFSGGRSHDGLVGDVIALDVTALLTLSLTGFLDRVLAALPTVRLPHGTLAWLFEEQQQAPHHQPSQVKNARELRDLLAVGAVESFVGTVMPDPVLAGKVGEELAALLAEARAPDPSGRAKFVVRPYPVHLVGSLMEEEVDLKAFGDVLVGCSDVVHKLRDRGRLTGQEAEEAIAYLRNHEQAWPSTSEIPDGSTLYIEDVSVNYLRHVGVLGKLRDAGFKVVISPREVGEGKALLQYAEIATQALEHIETVRSAVVEARRKGRLRFEKMPIRSEEEEGLGRLPTAQLLATEADCVVIDDRALNRHTALAAGGAAITSSLAILERLAGSGVLSSSELWAARTRLRLAGFTFVPTDEAELFFYLEDAKLSGQALVETAELLAIRTSLNKIRMGTYLRLPQDGEWFQATLQAIRGAIMGTWERDIDLPRRRAISNWLFDVGDMAGWLHVSPAGESVDLLLQIIGDQIAALVGAQYQLDPDRAAEYRMWIDEDLIAPIAAELPGLMPSIDTRLKGLISGLAEGVEA